MKINQIYGGLLASLMIALSFIGCEQTPIIPDDVNSFYVVTTPYMNRDSVFDNGQLILFRAVGETAAFLDASRGVVQRSWFLDGGDVVDKDNDQLVEGDSLIQVTYNTPGIYTVRLVASLDSAELLYYDIINDTAKDATGNVILAADGSDSITCFTCKLLPYAPSGSMDTTFIIQVFDSIQADFTATQNGVMGETFEAGIPINFQDNSKGTPYDWEWTFRGAEPRESEKESAEIVWKKSGTYNVTLRASRPHIEGEVKREARSITKQITITPSTAPLEFLSATASTAGDVITLSFNQPLIALPDIMEFEVKANEEPLTIFKVSFPRSDDSSLLALTLDGNIPASSMYRVTSTTNIQADGKTLNNPIDGGAYFKGGGNLFPEGFGDMEGATSAGAPVVPENTFRNLIEGLFTSGTINSIGEVNGSQTYWKRPFPVKDDMSMHTEAIAAEEHVLAGNYSMKWTTGDSDQMEQHPTRGPGYQFEVGTTYQIVVWMKAEGGPGSVNIQVKNGTVVQQTYSNFEVKDGEWTRVVVTHVGDADGYHSIKFLNKAPDVDYYIDEVGVYTD